MLIDSPSESLLCLLGLEMISCSSCSSSPRPLTASLAQEPAISLALATVSILEVGAVSVLLASWLTSGLGTAASGGWQLLSMADRTT